MVCTRGNKTEKTRFTNNIQSPRPKKRTQNQDLNPEATRWVRYQRMPSRLVTTYIIGARVFASGRTKSTRSKSCADGRGAGRRIRSHHINCQLGRPIDQRRGD